MPCGRLPGSGDMLLADVWTVIWSSAMAVRQQIMVLYLKSSAMDTEVAAWAFYDGTGRESHMAGDQSEPPYRTGLHAMRDGWRLIQASPLISHAPGTEFQTSYLKYEFFFEKLIEGTYD